MPPSLWTHICCKQPLFPPLVARFLPFPPCLSLLSVICLSSWSIPALLLHLNQSCCCFCCFPSAFIFLPLPPSAAALSWALRVMLVLQWVSEIIHLNEENWEFLFPKIIGGSVAKSITAAHHQRATENCFLLFRSSPLFIFYNLTCSTCHVYPIRRKAGR